MKTLTANVLAQLAGETTTFATFWKITRKDSVVQGFTSNVADMTIDGVTYKAASGLLPSNIQGSVGKGVDNIQIAGVVNSPDITEQALLSGVYDDARVEVFLQDYTDALPADKLVLLKGYIGEVKAGRNAFEAEVRSLIQRCQQVIGKNISPICRATLGDARCGVNLAAFTHTGSVTAAVSRSRFTSSSVDIVGKPTFYFAYGRVTFTSGANAGKTVEIRSHDTASPMELTLTEILAFDIAPGDTFSAIAGCDLLPDTCRVKFSNMLNFDGEPFTPGADAVLRVINP